MQVHAHPKLPLLATLRSLRRICRRLAMPFVLLPLLANLHASPPPNIILITADDLGLQLGCYGDKTVPTPNLDALAGGGALFQNAYATQASCSPSRSSILTGLYPHQNGQFGLAYNSAMRSGIDTLPAILKRNGYRTGILGKLHVTAPEGTFPFDMHNFAPMETTNVRQVAQEAARFMEQNADKPIFLYVNYFDPHFYGKTPFPLAQSDEGIPGEPVQPDEVSTFPFFPANVTPDVQQSYAHYFSAVKRLDEGIGLLMREVDRLSPPRDTLVIFLGDQGPPYTRSKGTCYEAGLRIPLIMRWSGHIAPSLLVNDLVSTVDLVPTILAAVGIEPPQDLPGYDLLPLLEGSQQALPRQYLFTEFTAHNGRGDGIYYPRRTIRDDRYKLIVNLFGPDDVVGAAKGGAQKFMVRNEQTPLMQKAYETWANPPRYELYDLQNDPWEFVNLADDPACLEQLGRLKRELIRNQEQTGDELSLDLDKEQLLAIIIRQRDANLAGLTTLDESE